ncbi:thioesterase [Paenibacillus thiaminolyticus]|uniref:Thioesterase n=1 Tax=Paenibacillus thiaminolyticus TaxID=49283 RepID=A0AAP9DXP8_PANTH|nr:thioesterase [Paenibacillus thiaminolyticus]MCY9535195.1 thioesterase [Paenibacillus thiaminolyticus]MCY9602456.1 thioesterase [Paenibacillus thiaminolyticus]MCY9606108.1 thioesterase [Paenibacillus thiaminolyticus]MCY9612493.1 thioesterase [Paenibacillus thiaminolyticus]MCY9620878.1 thioesterase [Paenibacillus thiaminolyticus]
MKPGLIPGAEISFVVTVTPDMHPAFDGIVIHEVMSTVSMIYFMEKAGREMIVPFLEEEEEGSGFALDIKHVGPAVAGQEVTFRAVCTEAGPKRIICDVTAETKFNLVGTGSFTQAIFDKRTMADRFAALRRKVEEEQKVT